MGFFKAPPNQIAVCQPTTTKQAIQPVSQPVGQSASQPVNLPASQPVNRPASQPDSQSTSQPASHSNIKQRIKTTSDLFQLCNFTVQSLTGVPFMVKGQLHLINALLGVTREILALVSYLPLGLFIHCSSLSRNRFPNLEENTITKWGCVKELSLIRHYQKNDRERTINLKKNAGKQTS